MPAESKSVVVRSSGAQIHTSAGTRRYGKAPDGCVEGLGAGQIRNSETHASNCGYGKVMHTGSSDLRLICNPILKDADPINLHLNQIAWLHPKGWSSLHTNSTRRSGHNHIAGNQWVEGRAVLHERGKIEEHFAEGGLLHDFAIQARHDSPRFEICELVRCDHPRSKTTGVGEVFPWRELVCVVLPVAYAAVVVAGIAGNMIERPFSRNVATGFPYDDRQFPLEIEVGGNARP